MSFIERLKGIFRKKEHSPDIQPPEQPFKKMDIYCYNCHQGQKLMTVKFSPLNELNRSDDDIKFVSCEEVVSQVGAEHDEGKELFRKLLKGKKEGEPLIPVCSICHQDLRLSFDVWGTPIIGIAGGVSAGKTCYIGALWHQLEKIGESRTNKMNPRLGFFAQPLEKVYSRLHALGCLK
jgi:hypothetical protein